MPTYLFYLKNEDAYVEEFMTLAEREVFLKDPNVEQCVSSPAISTRAAMGKPDSWYTDKLKKIKEAYPNNKINNFR